MKLDGLLMEVLEIPMKVSFQHATASRSLTQSVLVTATTRKGRPGQGEGCPRQYVTGETVQSAFSFFQANKAQWLRITSVEDLKAWIQVNSTAIDENPAAFCAVELALLNALACEGNASIESLLGLCELCGTFQYSAVIGASSSQVFAAQLQQYLQFGLRDFKIKLFGRADIDAANISTFRRASGGGCRVRADANNLWSEPSLAVAYINGLEFEFAALEEPLGRGQLEGCSIISSAIALPVILDESFTRLSDFDRLQGMPGSWIVNLRVSKMGGILRSLAVAEQARRRGIPIIIGAQVGETSLLTRAALTVANGYRDILWAQEGAFGTRLLERDLVNPPIEFGAGGVLSAKDVAGVCR